MQMVTFKKKKQALFLCFSCLPIPEVFFSANAILTTISKEMNQTSKWKLFQKKITVVVSKYALGSDTI